jgi:hypothetical protein
MLSQVEHSSFWQVSYHCLAARYTLYPLPFFQDLMPPIILTQFVSLHNHTKSHEIAQRWITSCTDYRVSSCMMMYWLQGVIMHDDDWARDHIDGPQSFTFIAKASLQKLAWGALYSHSRRAFPYWVRSAGLRGWIILTWPKGCSCMSYRDLCGACSFAHWVHRTRVSSTAINGFCNGSWRCASSNPSHLP